jgi:hypothetical protein
MDQTSFLRQAEYLEGFEKRLPVECQILSRSQIMLSPGVD